MSLARLVNRLRVKLGRKPVYKITVYYKSGHKVTFKANSFTVSFSGGTRGWASKRTFRPVGIGWDSIESVYHRDCF